MTDSLNNNSPEQAIAEMNENYALVVAPNSLGGFRGAFYAAYNRTPTEQEVFDAGVRSGLRRQVEGTDWPMLKSSHLEAVIFAYNECFSKAYDKRDMPNPFSEKASQHAAGELGKRDGARIRKEDDEQKLTLRHQKLVSKEWVTELTNALIKECDRAVRQAMREMDNSGTYDTTFKRIVQDAIAKITIHQPEND